MSTVYDDVDDMIRDLYKQSKTGDPNAQKVIDQLMHMWATKVRADYKLDPEPAKKKPFMFR